MLCTPFLKGGVPLAVRSLCETLAPTWHQVQGYHDEAEKLVTQAAVLGAHARAHGIAAADIIDKNEPDWNMSEHSGACVLKYPMEPRGVVPTIVACQGPM